MNGIPNGRYTFSINTDFNNKLKPHQLLKKINDQGFSQTILKINTEDDEVYVDFEEPLQANEITDFQNIINTHTPTFEKTRFTPITPTTSKIKYSTYTEVATFNYNPNNMGELNSIELVSKCNKSIDDYSIKLINLKTNQIIAEQSGFNNTDFDTIEVLIQKPNNPSQDSILELQIKGDGTDKKKNDNVQVNSIRVYHGNS